MNLKRFNPHFKIQLIKPLWRWWLIEFTLFSININAVTWKMKYDTVRIERVPLTEIIIFNVLILIYFSSETEWENYLTNKHNKN